MGTTHQQLFVGGVGACLYKSTDVHHYPPPECYSICIPQHHERSVGQMRPLGKLKDIQVRTAGAGVLGDGGGLVLRVTQGVTGLNRVWMFRYKRYGHAHWMGLGSYPDVTLARAREKAQDARRSLDDGLDPLAQKRAVRASLSQQQAEQIKSLTFDQAAGQYIASHSAGWRNGSHEKQWTASLRNNVSPVIGGLPVATIDTALVLKTLEPIWTTKPSTASRIRARIESILDWARVRGFREGENPARWRGHLDHLLPRPSKVKAAEHHPSLPYSEMHAFLQLVRARKGATALALEFIILTAARAGEVVGMKWAEVDLIAKVWTVPASRMKAGREHRVPLSASAVALLVKQPRESEFVFPGQNRPTLSSGALDRLIRKRMKSGVCTHGFRSTFRTWAAERTSYPSEVAELALAHVVGTKVEQAYNRTDLFERRRRLMADWATFCETPTTSAEVIAIRA
jgi:integrase